MKKSKKSINIDVTYDEPKDKWHKKVTCKAGDSGCGGFVYFLGVIGAAVHYISQSEGFWQGVLAILKALVWPAFMVYGLLRFLG